MARKPRRLYDVIKDQDGSLVVRDVDLSTARAEAARLNAEANIVVGAARFNGPNGPLAVTKFAGMVNGERSRYVVKQQDSGLVLVADAKPAKVKP